MRAQGWNFVRLGVIWAGGQPTAAPELDADFERRLHDFLDLAHEHGLHVVLDVHEDSVGTATCGEGVPPWLSALATPGQVGKPLTPLFTDGIMYANEASWVPDATQQQCQEKTLAACAAKGLWDGKCWTNDTETWALYAGQTDYNVKNPCCMRYNGGGSQWSRLAVTEQGQSTMKYLLSNPEGRAHYARYIGLLARAVKDYPAAIGIELMNVSPPTSFPSPGFVPIGNDTSQPHPMRTGAARQRHVPHRQVRRQPRRHVHHLEGLLRCRAGGGAGAGGGRDGRGGRGVERGPARGRVA